MIYNIHCNQGIAELMKHFLMDIWEQPKHPNLKRGCGLWLATPWIKYYLKYACWVETNKLIHIEKYCKITILAFGNMFKGVSTIL